MPHLELDDFHRRSCLTLTTSCSIEMIPPTLKMRNWGPLRYLGELHAGSCWASSSRNSFAPFSHCRELEATSLLFWATAFRETSLVPITPTYALPSPCKCSHIIPGPSVKAQPPPHPDSLKSGGLLGPCSLRSSLSLACSVPSIARALQPKRSQQCRPVAPSPGGHRCCSSGSSTPQPE